MNKIGFACIILNKDLTVVEGTRMRTTTVKNFSTLNIFQQREKIEDLAFSNLQALSKQVDWLCKQPEQLKFMRITSDLFPLYTHPLALDYYKMFKPRFESVLSKIGNKAKTNNVRLTSHPDQFVVLNSNDPELTARSVLELEYHTMIFDMMNLSFANGTVINLHGGKKDNGLDQFVTNSKLVSDSCRSMISVENDEFSFGIDDLLNSKVPENFPVVADIHHHWINDGNYIETDDARWSLIKQSWRGQMPKIHVSTTPEELVRHLTLDANGRHIIPELKRSKFRSHSDMIWNKDYRNYALGFLKHGDLMIEAKHKNLAAEQLIGEANANEYKQLRENKDN